MITSSFNLAGEERSEGDGGPGLCARCLGDFIPVPSLLRSFLLPPPPAQRRELTSGGKRHPYWHTSLCCQAMAFCGRIPRLCSLSLWCCCSCLCPHFAAERDRFASPSTTVWPPCSCTVGTPEPRDHEASLQRLRAAVQYRDSM